MTDRLTQLQDQVNLLSERFSMFTGVLQRDAPPVPLEDGAPLHKKRLPTPPQPGMPPLVDGMPQPPPGAPPPGHVPVPPTMEVVSAQSVDMAQTLVENVKDIDELIDSLPGIKSTKPQQLEQLSQLQQQNMQLTKQLEQTLAVAEESLGLIRQALQEIYTDRLRSHGL